MVERRNRRIVQASLVVAFAYFGLARPDHASAASYFSPPGEGASSNLPGVGATGATGDGLISVDEATGAATAQIAFEVNERTARELLRAATVTI